jgi:hypothetical protein
LLYLSVYFELNRNQYYDLLLRTVRAVPVTLSRGSASSSEQYALRPSDAEERTVRLVELQAAMRSQLLQCPKWSLQVGSGEFLSAIAQFAAACIWAVTPDVVRG